MNEVQRLTKRELIAIFFAILFPTLMTFVYFTLLGSSPRLAKNFAYSIGKLIQFGFPIFFLWKFYPTKLFPQKLLGGTAQPKIESQERDLFWIAFVFAVAVSAGIFVIYYGLIQGSEIDTTLRATVKAKVSEIGFATPWKFIGLGVFYVACHSFLEEYYWRWFTFWLTQKHFGFWIANLASSFGFMLFHVLLLGYFLGWDSPLTYLFSLCIGVGGAVWAALYRADGRLRNIWMSHAIVDAAIYGLGYYLVFAQ